MDCRHATQASVASRQRMLAVGFNPRKTCKNISRRVATAYSTLKSQRGQLTKNQEPGTRNQEPRTRNSRTAANFNLNFQLELPRSGSTAASGGYPPSLIRNLSSARSGLAAPHFYFPHFNFQLFGALRLRSSRATPPSPSKAVELGSGTNIVSCRKLPLIAKVAL